MLKIGRKRRWRREGVVLDLTPAWENSPRLGLRD